MDSKQEEAGVTMAPANTPPIANSEKGFEETHTDLDLPTGWMYRQRRLGKLSIPWFASPKVQLLMVAFVCFLCPGMFNALGGLGGGGKTDATLADNMVRTSNYPAFRAAAHFQSRTLLSIVPSLSLVSLVELSSISWVSS
mgnify:FL=1